MSESLLDVIHNSAKGLHEADVMGTMTIRKFAALCLPPSKEHSAAQIKRLGRKKASQAVFAAYLNTRQPRYVLADVPHRGSTSRYTRRKPSPDETRT